MNKWLVAIGGGNWQKNETLHIDLEIFNSCNKRDPNVLFFPTAARDDQGYAKRFKQYYRSLGFRIDAIRLLHTHKTKQEITNYILHYDLLYLGGGDSCLLMKVIQEKGLQDVFHQAYAKGIGIIGYSAGANVLFQYGYTDATTPYSIIKGMGIAEGIFTPHAQDRPAFIEQAQPYQLPCIACNDGQAYRLHNDASSFIMG